MIKWLPAGLLLAAYQASATEEVLHLDSAIIGNQEQPKVLYIVPWQSPVPPSLPGSASQPDGPGPGSYLDRESFVRELNLRRQLAPQ